MAKILHRGHSEDGLMRGEGRFEILQTTGALRLQLENIEKAGRICYRSERRDITQESANKFIRMIIRRGHESVIEHSCMTVIFSNVSRGFTHEMVRHRLCAFSQESTRYVDYSKGMEDLDNAVLVFIAPPHIELSKDIVHSVEKAEQSYLFFRRNDWIPQDARQFLPIGIASKIAVTGNFRKWRHVMAMRTQEAAHWEIRYVMCDLLATLKEIIPVIFEDFKRDSLQMVSHGGERTPCEDEFHTDSNGYAYYKRK